MSTSTPAPISNARFWLASLGILFVWTLVIVSADETSKPFALTASNASTTKPRASPTKPRAPSSEKEAKNTRNCKALCEHCGCMGFYCGEECICECNDNANSDTECIATMQSNARKLDIPFEILIQGPSGNRFVRNAFQFDQNEQHPAKEAPAKADVAEAAAPALPKSSAGRNKRSTVVIYKPAALNSLDEVGTHTHKLKSKQAALESSRHKRSVNQLDWFSDFANTLVRPAPLGVRRVKPTASEDAPAEAQPSKRSADNLDRSWFTDNANMLLRPSPFFRRSSADQDEDDGGAAMPPVRKMIKDTIRNIKDTDLGETLRMSFKDGADVFQDSIKKQNMDIFPKDMRDSFTDTLQNMKAFRNDLQLPKAPPPPVPTAAPSRFNIPWFRPVRFLQRVQQAIN